MVRATEKILHPSLGSLLVSPKLAIVFGFLATAITSLVALSWFHRHQVEEALSAEERLKQIAVLTREINNLTLTALQKQSLPPQAAENMQAARHSLHEVVLGAHLNAYHTSALEKAWPLLDNYIESTRRQSILIQDRDFNDATKANLQVVSSQFDLMQYQVQIAIDGEEKWAQSVALRARNEFLAAAVLGTTAILILFLRLKTQEHLGQLREAERNALRDSEERFRALTEQSTDIILIADPSGQIKYASPSVYTVLAVRGEVLVGTNLIDLMHPEDFAKTISPETQPAAGAQNPIVEF